MALEPRLSHLTNYIISVLLIATALSLDSIAKEAGRLTIHGVWPGQNWISAQRALSCTWQVSNTQSKKTVFRKKHEPALHTNGELLTIQTDGTIIVEVKLVAPFGITEFKNNGTTLQSKNAEDFRREFGEPTTIWRKEKDDFWYYQSHRLTIAVPRSEKNYPIWLIILK